MVEANEHSCRTIDKTWISELFIGMRDTIKNVLESYSAEERSEVAAYLGVLERIQDSHFQREMRRRSDDLQSGRNRLSAESVAELNSTLSSRGL